MQSRDKAVETVAVAFERAYTPSVTQVAPQPARTGRADPFLGLVEAVVSRHDTETGATQRDNGMGTEFGFALPLVRGAAD